MAKTIYDMERDEAPELVQMRNRQADAAFGAALVREFPMIVRTPSRAPGTESPKQVSPAFSGRSGDGFVYVRNTGA